MADTLVINEVFYSIQGESSFAGLPCVFVRLTACNLRCTWCDTTYSFHEGTPMTIGDLIVKVLEYNCPLVEITGGEPLLQSNVFPLMSRLCDLGKRVLVETSGSIDVSRVDPRVVKIMDLKAPGSGECGKNLYENVRYLDKKDEVKFVITDRADYDWAKLAMAEHQLASICTVLFSPVWSGEAAVCNGGKRPAAGTAASTPATLKALAEWVLADKLPVRVQTQLHKHIWGADTRGV